jgi:hypothetical protein
VRIHLFLLALLPLTFFNTVHAIRSTRNEGFTEPEAKLIPHETEDKLQLADRRAVDEPVERELAPTLNSTVLGVHTYNCTASELKTIRPILKTVRQKSAKLRSCFDTNSTATSFKNLVKRWFGNSKNTQDQILCHPGRVASEFQLVLQSKRMQILL